MVNRRNDIFESMGINRIWVVALFVFLSIEICCLAGTVWQWSRTEYIQSTLVVIEDVHKPTKVNNSILTTSPIRPTTTPIFSPTVGTPETTLTESATPSAIRPTFDVPPPGKIVFTCFDGSFDQICIMNADGSDRRQLTFDNATNFYPSLSPSGEQIVYSSNREGNFEIYIMNVDGRELVQLTDDIGNLYAPEISPKGNRIIFTAETGGLQSIWVMKINGDNARQFVESSGNDIDPSWSPDASQIVFASKRTGNVGLYVANADGSNPRGLTPVSISTGGRSSWSPRGFWIAYYTGPDGDRDIYTIGTDGKNITRLTYGGDNLSPSYSPDGEWLTFTSFRDGNNEIYVMRTDGSQVHRLTVNPLADWQPRWGP